jgi:hypothetical protein
MTSDSPDAETQRVIALFSELYDDIEKQSDFATDRPFLAHYTSVQTLDSILRTRQIWLSNPLLMNDRSEVAYGRQSGIQLFALSEEVKQACKTTARWDRLSSALLHYMNYYDDQHILDTYVLCLSQHEPGDTDGLLSMWRAYGANGNGVAIVFDTSKILPVDGFPIILAPVAYLKPEERNLQLQTYLSTVAKVLSTESIADDQIYLAAYAYFERLKLFSLFTKHHGFAEEREWRAVYMPDRDNNNFLKDMIGYTTTTRGAEPKLKLNLNDLKTYFGEDFTLDNLISQIVIGPTIASAIQRRSMRKLLESAGSKELAEKCVFSDIPFRG